MVSVQAPEISWALPDPGSTGWSIPRKRKGGRLKVPDWRSPDARRTLAPAVVGSNDTTPSLLPHASAAQQSLQRLSHHHQGAQEDEDKSQVPMESLTLGAPEPDAGAGLSPGAGLTIRVPRHSSARPTGASGAERAPSSQPPSAAAAGGVATAATTPALLASSATPHSIAPFASTPGAGSIYVGGLDTPFAHHADDHHQPTLAAAAGTSGAATGVAGAALLQKPDVSSSSAQPAGGADAAGPMPVYHLLDSEELTQGEQQPPSLMMKQRVTQRTRFMSAPLGAEAAAVTAAAGAPAQGAPGLQPRRSRSSSQLMSGGGGGHAGLTLPVPTGLTPLKVPPSVTSPSGDLSGELSPSTHMEGVLSPTRSPAALPEDDAAAGGRISAAGGHVHPAITPAQAQALPQRRRVMFAQDPDAGQQPGESSSSTITSRAASGLRSSSLHITASKSFTAASTTQQQKGAVQAGRDTTFLVGRANSFIMASQQPRVAPAKQLAAGSVNPGERWGEKSEEKDEESKAPTLVRVHIPGGEPVIVEVKGPQGSTPAAKGSAGEAAVPQLSAVQLYKARAQALQALNLEKAAQQMAALRAKAKTQGAGANTGPVSGTSIKSMSKSFSIGSGRRLLSMPPPAVLAPEEQALPVTATDLSRGTTGSARSSGIGASTSGAPPGDPPLLPVISSSKSFSLSAIKHMLRPSGSGSGAGTSGVVRVPSASAKSFSMSRLGASGPPPQQQGSGQPARVQAASVSGATGRPARGGREGGVVLWPQVEEQVAG
jgi:hypothetical protein